MLARLADEPFDVLVVGGGITGAGCALDAASRGLRTALVERADVASGTSAKSSKLLHGGIRYLQQREFGLVYEGLRERHLALENAPHLVRLLPFLVLAAVAGGLGPDSVHLLEPIAEEFPDISIDAQGRLKSADAPVDDRGHITSKVPADLARSEEYIRKSCAILDKPKEEI